MKKLIFGLAIILFTGISYEGKSQCDVTITPQSSTTFCEGDSVVLVASGTASSMTLDQSQEIYDGGTSARNLPGYSYWQSFQAGITGMLSQIDIGFFTYINGTGYLTVWEGSGTSGQMLDSQVVTVYCGGGNCLLSFPMSIPITAGEMYTFQIRGGPGMPDPYGIQIGSMNPYTNGLMGFVDPSGTYPTDFDMVFNTYVGETGLTYSWSTGETDSAITVDSGGTYTVTATSSSGCTSSAAQEITVNSLPNVSLEVSNDTVCLKDATVTLEGTPAGGIYGGINVNNNIFTPTSTGVFTVTYSYTDANGCTNIASSEIVVEICTGMYMMSSTPHVSVVPGISGNELMVKTDNIMTGIDFCLYDIFGEKVLSMQLENNQTMIDVSRNSAGIYLYVATKANQVIANGKVFIGK